ncbi:TPA: 16S rRNA pseudouridine(516) synthase [Burkholderia territorii]|uniref:pseudouridine synthase n=1 Tax=Burkholderia territorii TaxID=1503055 RepID=UPI0011CA8C02|nr:16S rRNA pseudouridine(516) synthase [Burkholderia territorii]TXG17531.1 16S rRNA pseudouridine(516) synthase [Burkholderia territorii]HDR8859796.1 16S rRNA pseudouridine(516) synthase [Burkholderia territorii]HDR8864976.1 16S rRNA pseudouridine(516) synthase [Burkholderia territorii]HDR8872242.1 16S rRNA pseudouridine(516) synthase [Burkholderia territorii]HDR8878753.1 16S rRNA pseudouridine(516) synthase [Burkholderia territorii]
MDLESILYTQGFGSRRQCRGLIETGRVTVAGARATDPDASFDTDGLVFTVDDTAWPFHARAYLALNKPAGYECSREPQHHASVFSLLPAPLVARGVQCVGRLDQDTTGLLLLSDDGQFVHAYTSPKRKVPKTYVATVRHPLDDAQLNALRAGVQLHGEPKPIAAVAADARDTHVLALTVLEGKYHQVKRMVAAASNRVEALHRESIGGFALPDDLAPGAWRWLGEDDLSALRNPVKTL